MPDPTNLVARIEAFVRDESSGDFDALSLEAFTFQCERLPAYLALCERHGKTPSVVGSWEEIPLVPTLAFRTLDLSTDVAHEVFKSSGTTSAERSIHRHPYPALYRATIEASFPSAALPHGLAGDGRLPILSLVPTRQQLPESSLAFMVDHVLARWGDANSLYAIGPRGVDAKGLRTWLAGRQRDGRPVLLMATALALLEALETLDRLGLRFRLPPGSLIFETGGYKGRRLESTPREIESRLDAALGIPSEGIVREYGMTELTSQLYARRAERQPGRPERANDLFQGPHWTRVRALGPQTLDPLPQGDVGMVAIFDLGNVGSAVHVLTEDLGSIEDGGLRLHGRAHGADLRGCSLTAEELISG